MLNWVSLLPTIVEMTPRVLAIINGATSNESILTKLFAEVPLIGGVLKDYGKVFFPGVDEKLQPVAAAMTAFSPDLNKTVQGLLNIFSPLLGLSNPNLVVDGFYGQKTMAAARAVQEKIGVPADSWFGKVSQDALMAFMQKNIKLA